MLIFDTNMLSELMKLEPDSSVVSWVSIQSIASIFTTTISQAEILYGIALLSAGRRKSNLYAEAQAMFSEDYKGRILPFDQNSASAYAEIASSRRASGFPIRQFDAQIAAITRTRGARLVTRNSDDFRDCGIEVINPWSK